MAAHSRVEELRRQLDDATKAASDADREHREFANALQMADRSVRGAERRRVDAQEHRDRLAKDN
jgi:hypothetical protein